MTPLPSFETGESDTRANMEAEFSLVVETFTAKVSSKYSIAEESLPPRQARYRRAPRRPPAHLSTLLLLAVCLQQLLVVSGTKHSFVTKHDARFLIGPIGAPFGFLRGGLYNLTVYDFELTVGHVKKQRNRADAAAHAVDGVQSGFLLKRFDSEGDFARYYEEIMDDPTICSFELEDLPGGARGGADPLSGEDDDIVNTEDDDMFQVSDSAATSLVATDGIVLSMADPDKTWKPKNPSITHSFTVGEEGLYFLLYQVCPERSGAKSFKEIRSSFELDLAYKNFDNFGRASYLTAGEMPLPTVFLYFSISYSLCLGLWVMNLRKIQSGGEGFGSGSGRPVIYAIHHMMSILLGLKTLSVFFESVRYHYIRLAGHAELWSVVYYTLAFVKGTFLFTVILLIGSGWSFLKPFLNDREKKIVCLVLVLQVIDNIAVVILTHETEGERTYDDWSAILHLVDILCCCAVLVPIVWQVNALEQSAETEGGSDSSRTVEGSQTVESGRTLTKLKLFRSFYLLVVAYIYFTRIVVFLFATMLGYRQTWLRYFVTELGTLAFYCVMGFLFRPMAENPYFEVRKDEHDDEEVRFRRHVDNGSEGAFEMEPIGEAKK